MHRRWRTAASPGKYRRSESRVNRVPSHFGGISSIRSSRFGSLRHLESGPHAARFGDCQGHALRHRSAARLCERPLSAGCAVEIWLSRWFRYHDLRSLAVAALGVAYTITGAPTARERRASRWLRNDRDAPLGFPNSDQKAEAHANGSLVRSSKVVFIIRLDIPTKPVLAPPRPEHEVQDRFPGD